MATIVMGYLVGGASSALYLWPHGGWYRALPILLGVISTAIAPLLLWGVVVTLYFMAIGSEKAFDAILQVPLFLLARLRLEGVMLRIGSVLFVVSKAISWLRRAS